MKKYIIFFIFFLICLNICYSYNENYITNKKLNYISTENDNKIYKNKLGILNYINDNFTVKIKSDDLIYVTDFLNNNFFNMLKNKIKNIAYRRKFQNNLFGKHSSGISKSELEKMYDDGFVEPLNLYYSNEMTDFIGKILNKKINCTNPNDDSTCSFVIYHLPNDNIEWHYDFNAYYGNRWTVLITIVNSNNNSNNLSSMKFCYKNKNKNKKDICLESEENSLLLFNGSLMRHMTTNLKNNELRIVLSLTYCDACVMSSNIIYNVLEQIKYKLFY